LSEDPDIIQSILGADGAVARRLGEKYDPRPQQIEMAYAVRDALHNGRHLLAEAGTGVGKSFAYLVPAIEYVTRTKKRVVISTHTISLQEQLIEKDIPLLRSLSPEEFTAVLVKGRNNYLCKRRLEGALTNRQLLFDDNRQMESLAMIDAWSKRKDNDGSLATLPQLPDSGVWDEVRAEHGNCMGKRCAHFEACAWQAAKRRMNSGNILVVNHALFFSDLALRAAGVQYLPKYDAVIFDEAHTIEDVAGQHFAVKLSESSLRYQLRQLYDPRRGKGILALQGAIGNEAMNAASDAIEAAQIFFDDCAEWQHKFGRSNGRVLEANILETDLPTRLRDLGKMIRAMLKHVQAPETILELTSKADRLEMTAQTVEVLLSQSMPDAVYWIDVAKHRVGRGGLAQRVTLSAAPVDVSAGLRAHLFEKTKSIVMTSATLCTSASKTKPKRSISVAYPGPMPSQRGTGLRHVHSSPHREIEIRQGANLPHWTEENGTFAVTMRLADSLPVHVVADQLSPSGPSALPAIESILDLAHGECLLRRSSIAEIVSESLRHFDGSRYRLLAWSIMPNHVHVVIHPFADHPLSDILHSFKRFTATKANDLLDREGEFWQSESYDHLIRDAEDLRNQSLYAYENPEHAGLEDHRWRGINEEAIDALIRGAPLLEMNHVPEARATKGKAQASTQDLPRPFQYIARRLGVSDCDTIQLGSPFDFSQQATLFLETNLPDPSDLARFMPAAAAKVEHYLRYTHGGAFVLFTSFAMLRDMAQRLKPVLDHLGLPMLVQGADGNARQLLSRFREMEDAVLFGTASFWQGIDVQGSKLRNVIITKLPFSVPDEPIIEAKLEAVTKSGGNAFMDLSLPEAIIRFKQGFGRLIRSRSDKGIVVVLDSRVRTKRYGKQFLDALPDVRLIEVKD
jgi:Rad3-related DNA helicase/REP element-mobilizing transposase RayT